MLTGCLDASRIPYGEIPLQTTLTFRPPPVALATTYLQSLALREGFTIPRESLAALYESTFPVSMHDLLHELQVGATVNPQLPVSDLHRALHRLQYLCQSHPSAGRERVEIAAHEDIEEPTRLPLASFSPEIDGDDEMTDWGTIDQHSHPRSIACDSERQGCLPRSPREEREMWQELRRITEAFSFADGHLRRKRMREEVSPSCFIPYFVLACVEFTWPLTRTPPFANVI